MVTTTAARPRSTGAALPVGSDITLAHDDTVVGKRLAAIDERRRLRGPSSLLSCSATKVRYPDPAGTTQPHRRMAG
jgi:hypothetical protein